MLWVKKQFFTFWDSIPKCDAWVSVFCFREWSRWLPKLSQRFSIYLYFLKYCLFFPENPIFCKELHIIHDIRSCKTNIDKPLDGYEVSHMYIWMKKELYWYIQRFLSWMHSNCVFRFKNGRGENHIWSSPAWIRTSYISIMVSVQYILQNFT